MSYYRTCPWCGANLDPGEQCDCKEKAASGRSRTESSADEKITITKISNQNYFVNEKE